MNRLTAVFLALVLIACGSTQPAAPPEPGPVPAQYASIPRYEKGGDITAPKVIKRVEPIAPAELVRGGPRRLSATLEAVIDTNGRVDALWYSAGNRAWADAAAPAISQWQFEPATRNGQPLAVRYIVTVSLTTTGGLP